MMPDKRPESRLRDQGDRPQIKAAGVWRPEQSIRTAAIPVTDLWQTPHAFAPVACVVRFQRMEVSRVRSMTLGDARQNMVHGPWAFAAVCLMVLAVTLLLFGQHRDSVIQLLPGYIAAYLLIGVCIFGPARKFPSLRQSVAFLLPGVLLAPLALLNLGFWAGGWLLGLPAWDCCSADGQRRPLSLWCGYSNSSACCGCRVDCSRSPDTGRLMVLALDIRRRRVDRRADDRVLGRGNPPPIPASAAQ